MASSYDIPQISFGGLASGLDSNAIIDALVNVQRAQTVNSLERQKQVYETRISAYSSFKTLLEKYQDAADALKSASDFNVFSTTLSDDSYFSATADSDATPGAYTVEISTLAKFEQEGSASFADKDASFGTGIFSITVGGVQTNITIEEGQDTLEQIASAINASDAEVTASVIDDGGAHAGNSATPYRLIITGDNSGATNTITVDGSGLTGGDESLATWTDEIQTASDASFSINGIPFLRESNTITDAIDGLNLTLEGTNSGSPVTLTVGRDTETLKENIKSFVDTYNEVVKFINKHSTYNESNESGGALMGDSMLTRIQSKLHAIFIPDKWDDDPNAPEIQILAQMGIEFENNSTLSMSDSEVETAIEDNFDDIVDLFTASDIGFAVSVDDFLEYYTQYGGMLDERKDSYEEIVRDYDDQIADAEARLEAYEAQLINKYANLESLMSTLQSQQSVLGYGQSQSSSYY